LGSVEKVRLGRSKMKSSGVASALRGELTWRRMSFGWSCRRVGNRSTDRLGSLRYGLGEYDFASDS
jgi:hypothetical protein